LLFKSQNNKIVKAIAFFKTRESFCTRQDLAQVLVEGMSINLLAHFEKSTFAGRTELRLRIVDII
jgi:hypothetical protein